MDALISSRSMVCFILESFRSKVEGLISCLERMHLPLSPNIDMRLELLAFQDEFLASLTKGGSLDLLAERFDFLADEISRSYGTTGSTSSWGPIASVIASNIANISSTVLGLRSRGESLVQDLADDLNAILVTGKSPAMMRRGSNFGCRLVEEAI